MATKPTRLLHRNWSAKDSQPRDKNLKLSRQTAVERHAGMDVIVPGWGEFIHTATAS
jgi:hypothetical protein